MNPFPSKMALDLLAKVTTFEIKHLASIKLQLRMGVHCGQVVCGLVGTKIPHYSVLGDTVEIAGLMESTGLPMMIQVTSVVHSHWSRNVEAWLSLVESVAGASSLMP